MSKNNNLLEVKNLRKHFVSKRSVTNAIDNVSFVVPKGKVVGLIGESGSGKTTIGRNIIRLHIPNSGSVTMENYEFATKKINNETRKYLRKNIQMIFQDPYASLNGQKNIMSIVAEPLIVNGTHKSMLSDILSRRDDVVEFFGISLKKDHLDDYTKYEEVKLKTMKQSLEELTQLTNELNINNSLRGEELVDEISNFIKVFFDNLDVAKIEILNEVRELFNKSLALWDDYKNKLDNDKYLDKFEERIRDARKVVNEIEQKMRTSELLEKLNDEFKVLKADTDDISDMIVNTNITTKKAIAEYIREYHVKYLEYKSKADESKTYGEYNYLHFLAKQNEFMIKSLKRLLTIKNISDPEIGQKLAFYDDKIFVTAKEIVKNLIDNMNNKKATKDKKDYFAGILFMELQDSLYLDVLKTSDVWVEKNDLVLEQGRITLAEVEKRIDDEKEAIKLKVSEELEQKLDAAKIELDKAIEANNVARVEYVKENEKTILIKLDKLTNTIQKTIAEQVVNEKEIIKLLDKKIWDLIKDTRVKFNLKSYKTIIEQRRKIKFLLQDKKSRVKQFNDEIIKNENELKIIRKLFNITNSRNSVTIADKAIKMNAIDKLKLRSLLVRRKVYKTLVEVGMNESHASRYPHEFSGGMRQRVGIARAIINDPKLIIADEPIAALDLSIQAQVMNLLMKLKRERELSMIFIAHDLSMIRYNSDYIQIMHLGKIVEHGETESVFTNPIHPYTKNLIDSMPEISEISKGFKGKIFKPEYRNNYSHINVPTYHKISDDHFVYADETQIKEWTSSKVKKNAKKN